MKPGLSTTGNSCNGFIRHISLIPLSKIPAPSYQPTGGCWVVTVTHHHQAVAKCNTEAPSHAWKQIWGKKNQNTFFRYWFVLSSQPKSCRKCKSELCSLGTLQCIKIRFLLACSPPAPPWPHPAVHLQHLAGIFGSHNEFVISTSYVITCSAYKPRPSHLSQLASSCLILSSVELGNIIST